MAARLALAALLESVMVRWAKMIMVGLGFTYVSYTAISALIVQVTNLVLSQYGNLPQVAFQLATYAGVHEALSIVLASFATGAAFDGFKRLRLKP